MKYLERMCNAVPRRLACLSVAVLILSTTAFAVGGGENRGVPVVPFTGAGAGAGGDSAAGGDDETVGTLPILLGGGGLVLHREAAITGPSLFLEGQVWEVMNAIVDVRGARDAAVTLLDPGTGRVRIVLPGRVRLALDRLSIENGAVQIGVTVPTPAIPSASFTLALGERQRFYAYPASVIQLPIVALTQLGVLDTTPFEASIGAARSTTRIAARSTADVLIVQQTR